MVNLRAFHLSKKGLFLNDPNAFGLPTGRTVACICWGRGSSRRRGAGREAPGSVWAASDLETPMNTQARLSRAQMDVYLGGFGEDAGDLGIFSRWFIFRLGLGGC